MLADETYETSGLNVTFRSPTEAEAARESKHPCRRSSAVWAWEERTRVSRAITIFKGSGSWSQGESKVAGEADPR